MSAITKAISSVQGALEGIQTVAILKERLALIRDQLEIARQSVIELEKENAALVEENNELREATDRQESQQEFVEYRGALFKPLAGGGYSPDPFCLDCHAVMFSFEDLFPFECGNSSCGKKVRFTGEQLDEVMHELP